MLVFRICRCFERMKVGKDTQGNEMNTERHKGNLNQIGRVGFD